MKEKEKHLHKVYQVEDHSFPVYREYDSQLDESYPVFPDFEECPEYTAEGRPFATAVQDKDYHNAVFVGVDENGIPRHAYKKNTLTVGDGFRGNVEGGDPAYSFHYISKNSYLHTLFAFEAPSICCPTSASIRRTGEAQANDVNFNLYTEYKII
ncbi:hypothetical protein CLNEO_24090 [Anaerotignum neopropionicum]|uniref:DUF3991 domain-containing protein n=1 Tax=Anaerotignum neopropionicum TaxID=36847 RepID=A0A136WCM7_9FIRM|nr:DUF3991 domain-containing protein [Anaerotignum neopropionicum]KXL52244.1 hypothetical protein CLNEO_24090 [Anaerotignum neopropionicum]